jgi:glycosyltransferase involved in cell wall biosynthesis
MDLKKFKGKYEVKEVKENLNNVNQNPLVSVCVQTYKHVNYIKQCLDGILFQKTNFEFEILLGEDDSNDGTRELCEDYAKRYPDKIRLFLHHRENNIKIGGQPTGRFNFLYNLHSSKGKYIALCEGDDYWTDPLKLQKQVDFLEKNKDYALHSTNANIYKNKEKSITKQLSRSFTAIDILKKNFTYTASLCFRKEDISKPDFFNKSPAGDWLLILYALKSKKGFFSNEVTCVYRIHKGGIWSQLEKENKMAIMKRFENLKANAIIYQHISNDNIFNNEVKVLAKKKQESYAYQAKRMTIIYPHLVMNNNDLQPKKITSFLKLKRIQIKQILS